MILKCKWMTTILFGCGGMLMACGPKQEPSGQADKAPRDTMTTGIDTASEPTVDSATETTAPLDTWTDNETALSSDSTVDTGVAYEVFDGGTVATGFWYGQANVRMTGDGSTVSPKEFSAVAAGDELCISGVVGAMRDWSGTGFLYMNVGEDPQGVAPAGSWEPADAEREAIYFNVTNAGATELRAQIENDTTTWCAVVQQMGGTYIPLSEFNTQCWSNQGDYYAGEPILRAGVLVPGLNTSDQPFEYCIAEMMPVTSWEPVVDTDVDTGAAVDTSLIPANWQVGVVGAHGMLQAKDSTLIDQGGNGQEVVLRGMSLFWSQWGGEFFTKETVDWLVSDWETTVIRAPLGISGNFSGYLGDPTGEMQKMVTVINAAIEAGIYVIIDWHAHEASKNPYDARAFFETMAKMYGEYPNVIYEVWNEPLDTHDWKTDIKPYAEFVIEGIRQYDPDNLVLVGTPSWSQQVLKPATDAIDDPNVAYVLHFYVGMHDFYTLTKGTELARKNGLTIFVSEWGVWEGGYLEPADANEDVWKGEVDLEQLHRWMDWADEQKLSMCMWSAFDKDEPSAILKPGASVTGNWAAEDLTTVGTTMREMFRAWDF